MVFDFEKAKENREKFKKDRETTKQERLEQITNSNPEEGINTYSVYLDVPNEKDPVPVYDIIADNPAIAIIKACEKKGVTEKQIIKKNCRARNIKTGELFSADGKIE
jgi:hypothetical protein